MNELVILSFDSRQSAAQAREKLLQNGSDRILIMPELGSILSGLEAPSRSTGRVRRWVSLPWRIGFKALGGTLTVVAGMSLIMGAIAGELAGRVLGLDEDHDLRQQIARAVPPDMEPVILVVRGTLTPGLIEELGVSSDHISRTTLSADAATRVRSALSPGQPGYD